MQGECSATLAKCGAAFTLNSCTLLNFNPVAFIQVIPGVLLQHRSGTAVEQLGIRWRSLDSLSMSCFDPSMSTARHGAAPIC